MLFWVLYFNFNFFEIFYHSCAVILSFMKFFGLKLVFFSIVEKLNISIYKLYTITKCNTNYLYNSSDSFLKLNYFVFSRSKTISLICINFVMTYIFTFHLSHLKNSQFFTFCFYERCPCDSCQSLLCLLYSPANAKYSRG